MITTYSAPAATLARCIRSVIGAGGADAVIVVDNGGRAVVPAGVELIRPPSNDGFGAAANAGLRRAAQLGAERCALLNDDVEVTPGWLDALVAELETDARVGAAQPKLLLTGTSPPRVNSVGVGLDRFGQGQDVGYEQVDDPADVEARDVAVFTGGAVLLAMPFVVEAGGFDERYFMYYEDVDLALRGAELGWRFRCAPASRVWHEGGASAGSLGGRKAYLTERNRLWTLFRFADRSTVAAGRVAGGTPSRARATLAARPRPVRRTPRRPSSPRRTPSSAPRRRCQRWPSPRCASKSLTCHVARGLRVATSHARASNAAVACESLACARVGGVRNRTRATRWTVWDSGGLAGR